MASSHPVAHQIQALIAEREIPPGGRLPPERELASVLGISRPSLREGMRRLVELGIVESRQGSGTYRAELDIADLLDVRDRLEPHAAGLAATRRSADDLATLDGLLAELRAAVDDAPAFAAVDARIHRTITAASGSLALRVTLTALTDLLRESRARTGADRAVRTATVAAHEGLVRAVHEGDADAAERAMRHHLARVSSSLR